MENIMSKYQLTIGYAGPSGPLDLESLVQVLEGLGFAVEAPEGRTDLRSLELRDEEAFPTSGADKLVGRAMGRAAAHYRVETLGQLEDAIEGKSLGAILLLVPSVGRKMTNHALRHIVDEHGGDPRIYG